MGKWRRPPTPTCAHLPTSPAPAPSLISTPKCSRPRNRGFGQPARLRPLADLGLTESCPSLNQSSNSLIAYVRVDRCLLRRRLLPRFPLADVATTAGTVKHARAQGGLCPPPDALVSLFTIPTAGFSQSPQLVRDKVGTKKSNYPAPEP